MKIGFLDSGVGGLTVLYEALKQYPSASYLYYADTKNLPYGTKSKKEIKSCVNSAVAFLINKEIDILVIACNTGTSVAIKQLRKKHKLPIIGMEPAIKPASLITNERQKILVTATNYTLKAGKLQDLISRLDIQDQVKLLSLQKLVNYAEDKKYDSKKVKKYLSSKLSKINWDQYTAVVLGCTHFIYFRHVIRNFVPNHVEIIDGNQGTIKRMIHFANHLEAKSISTKKSNIKFYETRKRVKSGKFKKYLKFLSAIDA